MLLAASTQRTIGFVILAIVALGGLAYIYFNIRAAREEVGSEIELAPNRSEPLTDENLEGKRLDLNLGFSLVMLVIIGVSLPVYWLGEPGRQEGRVVDTARIFTNRGEALFNEGANCAQCHGAAGSGGATPIALTDEAGNFVAQVNWKAPALNTVLSRFSEDEVLHTLNFGRNGVMPAWGAPGGGPLTEQQLEELVFYMRSIQIDETAIRSAVEGGLRVDVAAGLDVEFDDPAVDAFLAEAEAAVETAQGLALAEDPSLADLDDDGDGLRRAALELLSDPGAVPGQETYWEYGGYLFANSASGGTYNCARCHTPGWSYDGASDFTEEVNGVDGPLPQFAEGYAQGSGFFGKNLTGGSTLSQFESASSHSDFVTGGQTIGETYGVGGSGGIGQMPGFGPRIDDDLEVEYPGLLTQAQIDAIVAYERNL